MVESARQLPCPFDLPRADGLQDIVELAARYPHLMSCAGRIHRADVVVDVNVIAGFLMGRIAFPRQDHRLEELVKSGLLRLHIPHWAISELENSTIPKIAERRNLSKKALREQWERNAHLFQVHEQYTFPIRSNVLPGCDLNDEPYSTLCNDIGAWGVLSHDTHFDNFPSRRLSNADTGTFRDYARYEFASLSLRTGGTIVAGLTLSGIADVIGSLPSLWRGLPGWGQLAIVALGGYTIANPTARQEVINMLAAAGEAAVIGGKEVYRFDSQLQSAANARKQEMGFVGTHKADSL